MTGAPLDEADFPGDAEATVRLPDGVQLLFVQVGDPNTVKNRIHPDLRPGGPRDEEVGRLLGIGPTHIDDRRHPDGTGWVVPADPEGNEFCVLRSEAERAATEPVSPRT